MSGVTEALKEGRKLLEEQGWIQGDWSSGKGGFCALGAVNQAITGDPHPDFLNKVMPAWTALMDALPSHEYGSVAEYNDDPRRTVDDIFALYDRAIKKLEAEQ